ncbi:sedoheptulose-7-phosphate:D-glyceraldehyde-3- phosphate transaldolase [Tulasnella sp. 424]|nr:sedoheptulose-7-phosphate:D-glyceraldehyde-3- phosphate transaldolase [Tulasnella sp. 424]
MASSLDRLKASGISSHLWLESTPSFIDAAIDQYRPQDAATNPSLILADAKKESYHKLTDAAVEYFKVKGGSIGEQTIRTGRLLIEFGSAIAKIIPSRVPPKSTLAFPSTRRRILLGPAKVQAMQSTT